MATEVPAMVTYAHRLADAVSEDRLDHLAETILGGLDPLSFEMVRTPADVDAVLRMRFECMVEMGWGNPEDFPDGRERDEHDDYASYVVCRDAGEIVGSLRLVLPAPNRLLPTERDFDIRVQPPGDALDGGRMLIPRRHRAGRSHLIMAGLLARGWVTARERSYSRAISAATPQLIELYRRGLGLRIAVLGPPRIYGGEERVPIEIAGAETSFAPLAARLASAR